MSQRQKAKPPRLDLFLSGSPPLAAAREHARTYVYYARARVCVHTRTHTYVRTRSAFVLSPAITVLEKYACRSVSMCVCACVRVPHESAVRLRREGGEIRDEEEKPTLRIPRGRKSRRKLPLRTVLPAPGTVRAHAPFRTYLKERANRVRGQNTKHASREVLRLQTLHGRTTSREVFLSRSTLRDSRTRNGDLTALPVYRIYF